MKKMKSILSLFVAIVAISIQAQVKSPGKVQEKVDPEIAPVMTFEKTVADWGTINEGEKFETDFTFTNTGKTDLIITRIKGSCGCTVPSNWNKEPIKPGEKSSFHVTFNSRNKPNKQQKTVTVTCNTAKGRERVKIKGMVIPDPKMAKIREERNAKRKEMYAKRKAEREQLTKEKGGQKGVALEKRNMGKSPLTKEEQYIRDKELKLKREKRSLDKKRSKSTKAKERVVRKSDKEIKREEKARNEKLAIAKKDQKLREKELRVTEKEHKQKLNLTKKEQKLKEKEIRYSEKEIKRKEKEAKQKLQAEKRAKKEAAKKAKKAQQAAKKAEKAAKKTTKIKGQINKAADKVAKEETKLAKMQNKFDKLKLKGKLSPNEVTKKKLEMEDQIIKINEAKSKLEKVKRKL